MFLIEGDVSDCFDKRMVCVIREETVKEEPSAGQKETITY